MNLREKSDVLIIGGGVIGLGLARELRKKGAGKITVVERGELGREASYAAAGMLAPQAETDCEDEFFRFCSESNDLYPEFAGQLLDETGIDIELDRNGTLYLAFNEDDSADIRKRHDWQKGAGMAVEHLTAEETRKAEPFVSPDVRGSLYFPGDGQVENRKLMQALRLYAETNGIGIREGTEVTELLAEGRTVTGVSTAQGTLSAGTVVLATGAWTSLIKLGPGAVPVKIKPIKGQMITFQTAKRLFQRVIYSPRGYLVPRADGRVLAGATVEDAGFDKKTTGGGMDYLRETAAEIAPGMDSLEISGKWAGLRPFAADGLPVLGEIAGYENLLAATAHYRNGILLAPLTARIMAEKITGAGSSEYLEFFRPDRFEEIARETREKRENREKRSAGMTG
jgi:glycine oxidase